MIVLICEMKNNPHASGWYIVKKWPGDTNGVYVAYLRDDGQWFGLMRPDFLANKTNQGGTYFKTHEECVAICQKFNIEVTEEKVEQ